MKNFSTVLLALVSVLVSIDEHNAAPAPEGLRVCTWNIFRFGPKKFDPTTEAEWSKKYKLTKLQMIVEQLKTGDVYAIQEFFDSTEKIIEPVLRELKTATKVDWKHRCSVPVGAGPKEKYCFVWRTDALANVSEATYPEPAGQDQFSREPFFVQFKISKPGVSLKNIVLGTVHTAPEEAVKEVKFMVDASKWAEGHFKTQDVMTLGDYNADCQYANKKELAELQGDGTARWFIDDSKDTAAMKSDCTFDRAVSKSEAIKKSFVEGSVKILDFVQQYGIKVEEVSRETHSEKTLMTDY